MSDETARPFRLLDENTQTYLRWRCFGSKERAHFAALIECGRWAKIGTKITVMNIDTNRESGTYTRLVHTVRFD